MKNSLFKSSVRITLGVLAIGAASATLAQTYTFKIGGARIDPRATSGDLEGTLPTNLSSPSAVTLSPGNHLEVQPKSTLLFSVERSFNDHWSAELVLGVPPTHDVKLHASEEVLRGAALARSLAGGLPADYFTTTNAATASAYANAFPAGVQGYYKARAALKVAPYDGAVVARVKQKAPTLFLNYKFLDASSALRPYVGVGINYTNFKITSTQAGNDLYNDGPVRITSTDSIGFAFQTGASYKLDKNWLVSAGWTTAAVKNNVTIRTNNSEETLSYRFHPSVFSLTVGYQY